jgi:hypothetical protein
MEWLRIRTVIVPGGTERLRTAEQESDRRISTLNLNHWFTESPLRTREGRALLIDLLARHLPEALPRRYGRYQPPSEKWEIGGKTAFLDFLDQQTPDDTVVIYTSRPCVGFNISPASAGWIRQGSSQIFRCGCLQLAFEFTALDDNGWRSTIERAWLEIARIAKPFATNVEVLDGGFSAAAGCGSTARPTFPCVHQLGSGSPKNSVSLSASPSRTSITGRS